MTRYAAAAAAVAVVLLAGADVQGSPTLDRPGLIRITDTLVKNTKADKPPKGASLGDLDYRRQLLYNKRIQPAPIGHADVLCTNSGNGATDCRATYFLPKGEIVTGGVIGSRLFHTMAVLGGTGLYSNARGTLTVTSLGGKRELLVFRLET
jgi:hypothetical protein